MSTTIRAVHVRVGIVCAILLSTAAVSWSQTPAPPLFPKHRRGLYKNGQHVDVIDATPQSPPLPIDDPGVPDNGEFEVNVGVAADLASGSHRLEVPRLDANYGIVLHGAGHELPAQLKFEVPIIANRDEGEPYATGPGNAVAGVKLNFYNDENRGLRLSVYPQAEFSTQASVDRGLAEAGQTLVLPLLVSREFSFGTIVLNAGLEQPINDPDRTTAAELGVGIGRAFFRKLGVMASLRSESSVTFRHDRLCTANAGVIYGVRNIVWYAGGGAALFAGDGRHAYLVAGIKILADTRKSP
jgi:hypothetical protein